MDLSLVFKQGDPLLMGVFMILIIMSVVSWSLIVMRVWRLFRLRQSNQQFSQAFWQAENWEQAQNLAASSNSPLAALAKAGAEGLAHYQQNATRTLGKSCGLDEYLVRTIRMRLMLENSQLERGLTWLATTGSVAPFIGLFGTVWGIYHALIAIAGAGQNSIAAVSGPIGEALVATAAGLAAAIPAVVAYNSFVRANRVVQQEMDSFAHDVHAQLLNKEH